MKNDRYFLVINVFLLSVVLIGFAPSFFLRPTSGLKPLPLYMILHGISCTAWVIAIVLQSYWIQKRRLIPHRKMGLYFSLIAPVVYVSGLMVLSYAVGQYHVDFSPISAGAEVPEPQSFKALILTGDLIQISLFLAFVWIGYRRRNRADIHKRAMLIATILLCQQALVRLGKIDFLIIGSEPGASGALYATLVPFLLLVSMLMYDWRKVGKPTRISWGGMGGFFFLLVASFGLKASGLAVEILEGFR